MEIVKESGLTDKQHLVQCCQCTQLELRGTGAQVFPALLLLCLFLLPM